MKQTTAEVFFMDIDREKEGKCLTVTVPCYNSESYRHEEERTEQKKGSERNGSAASLYFFCFPSYAATSPVSIAAIHFIHLPLSLNF